MLKVYNRQTYVSINGEPWEPVGRTIAIMSANNPIEKIIFENKTFEECFEYLLEYIIPREDMRTIAQELGSNDKTFIATEKAKRIYIPDEYVLTGLSINSSSSEKAMISFSLASISFLVNPKMEAFV